MKKIMITGATGGLGGEVLSFLSQKVNTDGLYALARDPKKLDAFAQKGIHVIQGDYDDESSLVKAFSGIDTLYFVSGSDIMKRGKQHENVVAAAKEAGVKHILYTSFQRKNETESSPIAIISSVHLQTEQLIKESGINYTILKHALYNSILPLFVGQNVLEKGIIYLPAGDGKAALTSRLDMAKAAAEILSTPGHENKVYEISTPKAVSFNEIAEMLSRIAGKTVQYISPSVDEFKATLVGAGAPAELVGISAMFSQAIAEGEFDIEDDTLEKFVGKTESVEDFLKKAFVK